MPISAWPDRGCADRCAGKVQHPTTTETNSRLFSVGAGEFDAASSPSNLQGGADGGVRMAAVWNKDRRPGPIADGQDAH